MYQIPDFIYLSVLLAEVFVLLRLEKYFWGTMLTPLAFLMVPYTLIVLITISLPSSLEFVPFYYPSLLLWIIGLPIFAIPSYVLGSRQLKNQPLEVKYDPPQSFAPVFIIGGFLLLMSIMYLMTQSQGRDEMIGSEDFADETIRNGIWGHVREALLALMIFILYFFRRDKWYLYIFLIGVLLVSFVYQVKSWILIPILTGVIMRVQTKVTRLKFKYLIYTLLGSVAVFFLSYYIILVFAVDDGEFDVFILEMIYKHFLHYLISGVEGFSLDLQMGIIEKANPQSIFAQFINLYKLFAGGEYISPINPIYLETGWAATNVRTFFGTLWINLGTFGAIAYSFILSTLMYGLLYKIKNSTQWWLLSVYGWFCALLFMGWFEFYFFHLTIIEVPAFIYLYYYLTFKIEWKRN